MKSSSSIVTPRLRLQVFDSLLSHNTFLFLIFLQLRMIMMYIVQTTTTVLQNTMFAAKHPSTWSSSTQSTRFVPTCQIKYS